MGDLLEYLEEVDFRAAVVDFQAEEVVGIQAEEVADFQAAYHRDFQEEYHLDYLEEHLVHLVEVVSHPRVLPRTMAPVVTRGSSQP